MLRRIALCLVLVLLVTLPATAQDYQKGLVAAKGSVERPRLFECRILDRVNPLTAGRFNSLPLHTGIDPDQLLFDEGSGRVTFIKIDRGKLKRHSYVLDLLDRGGKGNDLLAARTQQAKKTYIFQVLKINVLKKQMPFFWHDGPNFYSGTCKVSLQF